jgi:hypothetical protein
MRNAPSKASGKKVTEVEPFDKRNVDFAKFKPDLTTKDLQKLHVPKGGLVIFPFSPIETLSPIKTIGRGRTNLTIIMSTIVQIDSTVPTATFDRRATPSRDPIIQMHFEPIAYGLTSVATYIMEFTIQTFGQSTFTLSGGPVPVTNAGTKVLNGPAKVSLIFPNLAPTQQVFGFMQQTAGSAWSWFATEVRLPPILISL